MTSKRSTLQEDTQFRVLRLLQENPEMSQREVADRVGISVGGTHYVLSALIEKGLVKIGNLRRRKTSAGTLIFSPRRALRKKLR